MLLTAIGLVAHELFTNPSERAADLEEALTLLLERLTPAMLKLEKPPSSPIEYSNIYDCPAFNIAAFVIRKGETMPIHDHPNMTVFTKLIHGDLHVKTFELMDETGPVRRARVITDKICTASTTTPSNSFTSSSNQHSSPSAHPPSPALTHASEPYSTETIFKIFPSDGPNLHSYSAVSDYAIIVDIMGPPYAVGEREITYFKEVPLSNNNTTEFVVENGSTPSSAALFDSFSSSSSSSDSCIPTTGSVKRKRSETGLSDDATDQVVAKKQTSSSQNSNSSTVVSTFNQHYCRKGALVSPTNSAKSFDDMCSSAKCIHESNGASNASFCQLQVDPSGEMEVTEKEYQGLPVRDFLKLLEIAHLNGKDRVVETLKICDRIGKTFDRLVASLVVAQS